LDGLRKRIVDRMAHLKLKRLHEFLAAEKPLQQRFVRKDFGQYLFHSHFFRPVDRFPAGEIRKQALSVDDIAAEVKEEEVKDVIKRNMMLIALVGGAAAAKKLQRPGLKYEASPYITNYVETYSADLAAFLAKELSDTVKAELLEGIQRGETLQQLTKRIDAAMVRPAPIPVAAVKDPKTDEVIRRGTMRHLDNATRAKLIARTETNRALNHAAIDAYKQAEVTHVQLIPGKSQEDADFIASNGDIFSINDAAGILPLHHNCTATWVPVIEQTA
jgi:SPP1 gp7 family putative phage head morphogenesis protein